ncbi:MAG: BMC domain-containing protein [Ruminococcaceae bacterium]|nr:BMC domain-containing protein [Oscillospiraceae bacterium]
MARAIGMIEYTTVSTGISAADTLVKTADVEIIEAQVVCPGKYIVIISGELSAIKASVDAAKNLNGEKLIDSFVLGNVHEGVFPAIYATVDVDNPRALGVIETFSGASAIVAADAAAKTADVTLVELRIARGMCGKSYMLFTGEVAAVTAAVESAKAAAGDKGMLLDYSITPNPDPKLWEKIL